MTGLQPYVLRSWEKEFPGIGVQKSQDSTRLYRQSDVDQVLRIKDLVFAEGLTLSGARRRIEELWKFLKWYEAFPIAVVFGAVVRYAAVTGVSNWNQSGGVVTDMTFGVCIDHILHRPSVSF